MMNSPTTLIQTLLDWNSPIKLYKKWLYSYHKSIHIPKVIFDIIQEEKLSCDELQKIYRRKKFHQYYGMTSRIWNEYQGKQLPKLSSIQIMILVREARPILDKIYGMSGRKKIISFAVLSSCLYPQLSDIFLKLGRQNTNTQAKRKHRINEVIKQMIAKDMPEEV